MNKKLVGNDEAAQYIGISKTTLPRWRWAGCGPAYLKIGKRILYRLEDLDAFLEGSRVSPRNAEKR